MNSFRDFMFKQALADEYTEGKATKKLSDEPLDFDALYDKAFRITYNSGDKTKEGWSIVTPLNGEAWNWLRPSEDDPTFKEVKENIKKNFGELPIHKYNQIYTAGQK